MECKSTTAAKKETAKKGINRNIVECKLYLQQCKIPQMLRINRNIVECKYASYTGASGTWAIELIETLWNVNLFCLSRC